MLHRSKLVLSLSSVLVASVATAASSAEVKTFTLPTNDKAVSVESKSGKGVYVTGGGTAPSKFNSRGERHVGAGVVIRFGGKKK